MMNEKEKTVQKHIFNLVKHIQNHVDTWAKSLENVARPLEVLQNQCEQLMHVEKAQLHWLDNFEELQNGLQHRISIEVHDTITELRSVVNHIKRVNNELKNKICTLETSSQHLKLENNSSTILKGSPTQPSLERLFKHTLIFYTFFFCASEKIFKAFDELDVRDQSSVINLVDSFKINLANPDVNYLFAITQYINEKSPNAICK